MTPHNSLVQTLSTRSARACDDCGETSDVRIAPNTLLGAAHLCRTCYRNWTGQTPFTELKQVQP